MHIVLGIVGALGALMYYLFIFRRAGKAVTEVVDVAERARGKLRRNAFRRKAEGSTLTAIQDPGTAAMVMLSGIAREKRPVTDEVQAQLTRIAEHEIGLEDAAETAVFADWVASEVVNPEDIARRFKAMWLEQLTTAQRSDFLSMAIRIAGMDGGPTSRQKYLVGLLRERLGLPD